MQLLGRRGEGRGVDLLNIIEQDVPKMTDFWSAALPHMGWNRVCIRRRATGCFRVLKMALFLLFTATRAGQPWTIARCNYGEAVYRGGTER